MMECYGRCIQVTVRHFISIEGAGGGSVCHRVQLDWMATASPYCTEKKSRSMPLDVFMSIGMVRAPPSRSSCVLNSASGGMSKPRQCGLWFGSLVAFFASLAMKLETIVTIACWLVGTFGASMNALLDRTMETAA